MNAAVQLKQTCHQNLSLFKEDLCTSISYSMDGSILLKSCLCFFFWTHHRTWLTVFFRSWVVFLIVDVQTSNCANLKNGLDWIIQMFHITIRHHHTPTPMENMGKAYCKGMAREKTGISTYSSQTLIIPYSFIEKVITEE